LNITTLFHEWPCIPDGCWSYVKCTKVYLLVCWYGFVNTRFRFEKTESTNQRYFYNVCRTLSTNNHWWMVSNHRFWTFQDIANLLLSFSFHLDEWMKNFLTRISPKCNRILYGNCAHW
jgi:hypothetical protein